MLNALEISLLINKYYKLYLKKKNIIYKIPYDIIGSENQFDISLKNFITSNNIFFVFIINYDNYHWVYLLINKTLKNNYKLLFYDSLGKNIKQKFYTIIKNNCIYFNFNRTKKQQQITGNTCGIFVIIIFMLIFSLINKNIKSINKLIYIIENNDINYLVNIFKKNEFSTKRNKRFISFI